MEGNSTSTATQRKNATTHYESEMIEMLSKMNEDMMEFAEKGLMTDHSFNQLSILQKDQHEQIKTIFRHINKLMECEYVKRKVTGDGNSLRKKRLTEREKRLDAKAHPEKYHICSACDSIFGSKFNLQRHQRSTLKCSVIKCSKKGALEIKHHRAPHSINEFISNHFNDADSDEEVEQGIQENLDVGFGDGV
tara:strand:+ start:1802 stop:2377 length:576 start_codon:yes stop_codon:yes gene_type:complete